MQQGNLAHITNGCRQQLCIQNCCQTAADRDMVTIDSLYEFVIALSTGTIVDPLPRIAYLLATIHALQTDRRQLHVVYHTHPGPCMAWKFRAHQFHANLIIESKKLHVWENCYHKLRHVNYMPI